MILSWTGTFVAVLEIVARASVVRAIGSVSSWCGVITTPGALPCSSSASLGTCHPRSPVTPVSVYISDAAAIFARPSLVANTLPGVVDTLAVLALPVRHALGAVGTSPSRVAPTLFWQVAKTIFRMTTLSANWFITRGTFVLAEAFALEGLVNTFTVFTV